MKSRVKIVSFVDQISEDQRRYSRYVCDSRAIPNEIDGMKPVQRRILWTLWNSVARQTFTKTVKVAGLVMGYHPHGDASIQDAIAAMTQDFTFANNYPLIQGEGTFGDVIDPKAIASPRYTEVRLSEFSKDVGLFESIPDIDYVPNYDESAQEPVFFVPKVPVVFLNNITGIATGFRCSIPGHKLSDIVDACVLCLKGKEPKPLHPWYRGFRGTHKLWQNPNKQWIYTTGFGFEKRDGLYCLTNVPQNWNREKTVEYLDQITANDDSPLRGYTDRSTDTFDIVLLPRKGRRLDPRALESIFSKTHNEVLTINVITHQGRLVEMDPISLVKRFVAFRKGHLIKRFKRLAGIEKEKIQKNTELIRFIQEQWNHKVVEIKNRKTFESKLRVAKFKYDEWLASIPVYRMTTEEVKKCREAIAEARKAYRLYQERSQEEKTLREFMIREMIELKEKWDGG